jgi:hypothetical protein
MRGGIGCLTVRLKDISWSELTYRLGRIRIDGMLKEWGRVNRSVKIPTPATPTSPLFPSATDLPLA